ncbi:sensor histidine kinase [Paraclostridium bifermentans]|uniref:sensor histidine kinase n=1 Tax=Paraclostridium bifermentans TaxID=1490 RepID=UPI00359C3177
MKLKNKLFISFATLFFITLNIFGYILIQSIFYTSLKSTIDNSFKEYSVIYSNIKVGENLNNLFLTNKELISIKSDSYLNNIQNKSINLEFRDLKKNLIYSSNNSFNLPSELFKFDNKNISNYIILSSNKSHTLVINKIINFNNSEYYFTYMNSLNNLYQSRVYSFLILLVLNILIGVLLIFLIYYISNDITKPLNSLIEKINQIIVGNYNEEIIYDSNIDELNTISSKFNILSEEIKNKIILLENKNLEKQRFIDNLTHEIRTPLTSIVGYSKLIIDKDIQDINLIHKSFENIYKDGKRIESLTENLIKLITLDKTCLDIKKVSVLGIINDIQSTFNLNLIKKDINFIIQGNDFNIDTDVYLISTLISNFIDNSIKAMSTSVTKELKFILNNNSITIIDTGCGIPKESLDKVFEPFYMVDKSRESSLGGFGLGLSICANIIKLLDIDFSIESSENIGTTITLCFKGGLM